MPLRMLWMIAGTNIRRRSEGVEEAEMAKPKVSAAELSEMIERLIVGGEGDLSRLTDEQRGELLELLLEAGVKPKDLPPGMRPS